MKLPNGYGSVYKLSGHRRKPWCARKTVGWNDDPVKMKSFPVYHFVGFYATKQDALQALSDYNQDPYDLKLSTITFKELYDRWSEEHFEKIKNTNGYKASITLCSSIFDMHVVDIKLDHFQKVVNDSGKNRPTLKTLKNMLGLMYDYAVIHEIITKDKRDMIRYVDIDRAGNPNARNRTPFRTEEIQSIWLSKDSNEYLSIVLILIHTGVRIGELLALQKDDIHLGERWFYVREAKTKAGIREVPIAEKIVPLMEHWISKDCDHLVCTPEGKPFIYRNYYDSYWKPLMDDLKMEHRPHDTRHTCISLLTKAGIDERIIRKIVGHKGQGVTETVYTHIDLPEKLKAINKI